MMPPLLLLCLHFFLFWSTPITMRQPLPYNTDVTIQLLYYIATPVFREQINEGQKPMDDILVVCHKVEITINKQ